MCCLHHRWKFLFLNWFVGFLFFYFISKSQTEEPPGLLTNGWTWRRDGTTQSDNKQSDWQTVNTRDMRRRHLPTVSKRRFCESVVGPLDVRWSRARSVSTPWGKTYIHETHKSHRLAVCVSVWLYETVLLRAASPANVVCALQPPCPRGMECLETSLLRSNLTYS